MSDESNLWRYRARLVRVIDGDTVVLLVDTGFGSRMEATIRIAGINAPELPTFPGYEARDALVGMLPGRLSLPNIDGWPLRVQTHKTRTGTDDRSFTRYVGDVYTEAGVNAGDLMVNAGYAERVK